MNCFKRLWNKRRAFFEWLVPYLLGKMGYGVSERDLSKISHQSRDGGIDGVIRQDKLGFSKIYIQAKRWDPQVVVGRRNCKNFMVPYRAGLHMDCLSQQHGFRMMRKNMLKIEETLFWWMGYAWSI